MFDLKHRLFRNYALLIILVVLVFYAVFSLVYLDANRASELRRQEEITRGSASAASDVLAPMSAAAERALSDFELINCFMKAKPDPDGGNWFDSHLLESIQISSILTNITASSAAPLRVTVFNFGGDYVSAGALYRSEADIQRDCAENWRREDALALPEAGVLRLYAAEAGDYAYLSCYRRLESPFGGDTLGVVCVNMGVSALSELSLWAGDASQALMDGEGRVLSGRNPPSAERSLRAIDRANLTAGDSATLSMDGARLLVFALRSFPDCYFVREIGPGELDAPFMSAYAVILLSGAAMLAAVVIITYAMASRIARPLQHLSEAAEAVRLQSLSLPGLDARDLRIREVAQLNQAFQAMLGKLNQSVGFEMRAYMNALQSQTNPHFLFNTLSVITEAADEEDSPRTAGMCQRLSEMLRYTAGHGAERVTLREEIQHLENYLALMKERYEDNLIYEIHAYEGALGCMVPRIILQPLAENCFQHAFKKVRPPWRILVNLYEDQDGWKFSVTDNGAGMSPEETDEIFRRVEVYSKDLAANYTQLRLGGMGLVNTVLRLNLCWGGGAHFQISHPREGGTTVQIGGPNE